MTKSTAAAAKQRRRRIGVLLWVMGFDILYACQDEAFDREQGLHSLPARVGRPTALHIAALAHLWAIPLFCWFGYRAQLGVLYYAGVGLAAVVLYVEHRVVRPEGTSGPARRCAA